MAEKYRYLFDVVYAQGDDGWVVAYIEELPGAHAQGKDIPEAREKLEEAIRLVLTGNRRLNHETFARARVLKRDRYPFLR